MYRGKHRSGSTRRWGSTDHVARHGKHEQTLDEFLDAITVGHGVLHGRR